MMTRNCFWLGCLLPIMLLFSCQAKRPEGILSKKQMVSALTEFYMKEARLNALGLPADSAAVLMNYYRVKYASEHSFPDSALDASYQYYLTDPKLLGEIYDQVIDSLALREQKAETPMAIQ